MKKLILVLAFAATFIAGTLANPQYASADHQADFTAIINGLNTYGQFQIAIINGLVQVIIDTSAALQAQIDAMHQELHPTGIITWNGGSFSEQKNVLSYDQGGSIELGKSDLGSQPYIDFHGGFAGTPADFDMRIINEAKGFLDVYGGDLRVRTGQLFVLSPTNNQATFRGQFDNGRITVDTGVPSKQTSIVFSENSHDLYQLGKNTDNSFFIWDNQVQKNFLRESGGVLTLQPGGGDINVGGPILCNGCISSNDIHSSFMVQMVLQDDAFGHSEGWDPDGARTQFSIFNSALTPTSNVIVNVGDSFCLPVCFFPPIICGVSAFEGDQGIPLNRFLLSCNVAPVGGAKLHETVINLPVP